MSLWQFYIYKNIPLRCPWSSLGCGNGTTPQNLGGFNFREVFLQSGLGLGWKKVCEGGFHGFWGSSCSPGWEKVCFELVPKLFSMWSWRLRVCRTRLDQKKKIKITQLQQKRCFFFFWEKDYEIECERILIYHQKKKKKSSTEFPWLSDEVANPTGKCIFFFSYQG